MKKGILCLLSVFMIALLAITGCGKDDGTSTNKPQKDGAKKVAILLNGNRGDKAFFDSAANGGELIKKELGWDVKVVEMTYDKTKWEPTLVDYSENSEYDIIVVGTWQMNEILEKVAQDYPNKKYVIFDSSVNYKKYNLKNVYSMEYKQNESSFLAGAVAAMQTKSGIIGYVGGMENQTLNDFLIGYIQGAKAVKPDIKIAMSYIGNFNDSAKGKELALAQINSGADIVYQVASTAGLGVIDAATEKNVMAIGVDSDQEEFFKSKDPAKAKHILTSALKRIDISILRAIKLAKEDKLKWGEREVLSLNDECLGIAKNDNYKSMLSEENKKKIEEFESKMRDGSLKVDTAFEKTTEQIEEIRKGVRP